MATYQVVVWQGIPASVEASDADGTVTVPLSDRFQALIDSVAMQLGLSESDAYIEAWTREVPPERAGPAGEVAHAVAAEIEDRFQCYLGRAFARPA